MSMRLSALSSRSALIGLALLGAAAAAPACSNAGLQGLYLWPMQVQTATRSCQVSVHLMFDGQGHGWMQPVDDSCPRPGAPRGAGVFRYQVDEECSGTLTDASGRYQLELENEDVELTLARPRLKIGGVATRQRELMPGEQALIDSGKRHVPTRPDRGTAR